MESNTKYYYQQLLMSYRKEAPVVFPSAESISRASGICVEILAGSHVNTRGSQSIELR